MDDSGGRGQPTRRPPSDDDDQSAFLARSLTYLQENVRRSGPVAVASYGLAGAIFLFGGIGYALDKWLGTPPGFLLGGLLLGIVVGFYQLGRAIWPR